MVGRKLEFQIERPRLGVLGAEGVCGFGPERALLDRIVELEIDFAETRRTDNCCKVMSF